MHRLVVWLIASSITVPLAALAAEPPIVLLGSHVFKMVDDTTPPIFPGKRKFVWKVRSAKHPLENQVVIPDIGSAGDPTLHGGTLTVYNAAGSGELYTVDLPAEEWLIAGNPNTGFRYVFAAGSPVRKVWITSPKITIQGGKSEWGYSLDEPSQGLLAVRLTLGTGVTWCAVPRPATKGNPPSSERFDRQDRYRAERLGLPPAACPPLPAP